MGNTDQQLTNIARKLDKIWIAIQGDEEIYARGLINRVKDLESRVKELENFKTRVLFVAAGAAVGSSTLTAAIVRFLLK